MKALALAVLLLASCGGGSDTTPTAPSALWEVGPSNYPGGNPSTGHMQLLAQGWQLTIPQQGSAHYVTQATGSLIGKSHVTMHFRLELDEGASIVPVDARNNTPLLTLYFQKDNLCWSQECEAQRWFAPVEGRKALHASGEYVLTVPFTAQWTGALHSTRSNNQQEFLDSLMYAGRIGFVLGGGEGLGHGVTATGHARIVVLQYTVE